MQLVSVWSPKGGSGKTTLALHLAGAMVARGVSVLLVDLDPQWSAKLIGETGSLPFSILPGWPTSEPKVDVIVADYAPGYSEAPEVGTVVVPMQPSPLDMNSAMRALEVLRRSEGLKVIRVLNMVDLREVEQRDLAAYCLRQREVEKIVKRRSVYRRSLGAGHTVHSAEASALHGAREAKGEVDALLDVIL